MSTRHPEIDPGESVTIGFDFSAETSSVSAPTVTVSVFWASGSADPNPNNIKSGAPTINGAQVLQHIAFPQDGNDYALRCSATAANGDTLVVASILPCRLQPK